jgi:uncharacterized phage protein gp47/JayE
MGSVTPYIPPYVGPAGLVVNDYQSILADNLQAALNIVGQNQYLAQDTWLYQLLSVLSLKQADQNAALQLCYNQSSPQTAVGAGLDRVIKMNGLARDVYTYSTCQLTCVGTAGFNIINGFAQDQNGNLWALPSPLTIVGGSVTVVAECTTPGAVTAEPGTIVIIATPQSGWATVTNASAATPGAPVEPDSSVRARQAISVALPGLTPIASTIAAVLTVNGVIRTAPGYPTSGGPGSSIENPTGADDSWGNPAHSISLVVQGGAPADVALAIYLKKTIGCYTNGTTSVTVTDPNTGYEETISYYQPTSLPIYALVTLVGYGVTPTSAAAAAVQAALVAYLNALEIGETVSLSALIYEAMSVNAALTLPSFGVQSMVIGTATAVTTATVTLGSDVITVASAVGIIDGQLAVGSGIPAGTTVINVSGTNITLSANATVAGTLVPVVFSTLAAADIAMPTFYTAALGAAADVAVVV